MCIRDRHQRTQCPRWFILEKYKLCGHRPWDGEEPKQPQLIKVRQVKCQRTWYENTTKQARPEKIRKIRTKKTKKRTGVMKNDARSERLQEEQHTCSPSKIAGNCSNYDGEENHTRYQHQYPISCCHHQNLHPIFRLHPASSSPDKLRSPHNAQHS